MENCAKASAQLGGGGRGLWKKPFKDCLKPSLKDLDIDVNTRETASAAEARRIAEKQRKRAACKARADFHFNCTVVPDLTYVSSLSAQVK